MPRTWGEDDPVIPPRSKGRHHKNRGRSQYRPAHKRKRGCGKTAATAALVALGALAGLMGGMYLLLLPLLIAWQAGP